MVRRAQQEGASVRRNYERLVQDNDVATANHVTILAENGRLQQELAHANTLLSARNDDVETINEQLSASQLLVNDLRDQIAIHQKEVADRDQLLVTARSDGDTVRDAQVDLRQEVAATQAKVTMVQQQLRDRDTKLVEEQKKIDDVTEQLTAAKAALVDEVAVVRRELQQVKGAANVTSQRAANELGLVQMENADLKKKLEDQRDNLRRIDVLQQQIDQLETQLAERQGHDQDEQQTVDKVREEHQREVDELRRQHVEALAARDQRGVEAGDTLRRRHAQQINAAKQREDDLTESLKRVRSELEDVQQSVVATCDRMQQQHETNLVLFNREKEREISTLQARSARAEARLKARMDATYPADNLPLLSNALDETVLGAGATDGSVDTEDSFCEGISTPHRSSPAVSSASNRPVEEVANDVEMPAVAAAAVAPAMPGVGVAAAAAADEPVAPDAPVPAAAAAAVGADDAPVPAAQDRPSRTSTSTSQDPLTRLREGRTRSSSRERE